ncbi:MAG TPA: symmetrical bis(5'-nucleosyl)-tetraphosphatase, partial [Gammaproteobacteria bacterium]|nr:symmetrical bis(5'-nucleosyl)-tetraphosphatase [Gammaproteobacteria bacterium]
MPTYAIGDVQGCFSALKTLLAHISFHPKTDTLWFTGDLVNRGSQSLETLRFIKNLGNRHRIVLGNHDLHLLAVASNAHAGWKEDTLNAILTANDRKELLDWLIQQPLFHHDEKLGFSLVHAGLAPAWDLMTAKKLANEVETILQSADATDFFRHMYSNEPDQWNPLLHGFDRLRCITNYFTRARLCHLDGRLELKSQDKIAENRSDLLPWFRIPNRVNANLKIIFGHW